MKFALASLLLLVTSVLPAQSKALARYENSPVYAQIGVGGLPIVTEEISFAAGYRFNPKYGIGAEFRSVYGGSISVSSRARVLGLQLRGQFARRVIVTVSGGTVLTASRGEDTFDEFEYRSGGGYGSAEVAYQLTWGLTLGVYLTMTRGQTFDVSTYNFDTGRYEPTGTTFTSGIFCPGLKVGFAFPWRARRARAISAD